MYPREATYLHIHQGGMYPGRLHYPAYTPGRHIPHPEVHREAYTPLERGTHLGIHHLREVHTWVYHHPEVHREACCAEWCLFSLGGREACCAEWCPFSHTRKLFPFHCWASIPVPFPFHCWARQTRSWALSLSLLHPFHCWRTVLPS